MHAIAFLWINLKIVKVTVCTQKTWTQISKIFQDDFHSRFHFPLSQGCPTGLHITSPKSSPSPYTSSLVYIFGPPLHTSFLSKFTRLITLTTPGQVALTCFIVNPPLSPSAWGAFIGTKWQPWTWEPMEGSVLHRYSPPPCAGPPLPPVVLVVAGAINVVLVSEEILCRVEKVHWSAACLLPSLYFAILSRVFQETFRYCTTLAAWNPCCGLLLVFSGKLWIKNWCLWIHCSAYTQSITSREV